MSWRNYLSRHGKLRALIHADSKNWIVIFGYHLHKQFFALVLGLIALAPVLTLIRIVLILAAIVLVVLSIIGQLYNNQKPRIQIWNKVN